MKNKHQAVKISWRGHNASRGVESSLKDPQAVAWADGGISAQPLFIGCDALQKKFWQTRDLKVKPKLMTALWRELMAHCNQDARF